MSTAARRLRVLVVGLDGATWSVLEPGVRAGRLPHLARVMAGAWGPLESTVPPITPPAWTSFVTGKNPGKHGLYDFIEPDPGTYGVRYTNARSRRDRSLWSLLSEAGHRVGVVNVPMSFPPEAVNGFMVSGMDTPDEASEFVHPPGLLEELRRAVGPIRLEVRYLGFMRGDERRQQVLQELAAIDEQRLAMMVHLLERHPVEVLMVVYGSPDTCQHYFWHYADPSHHRHDPAGARQFGAAIQAVYERLDRHLGVLLEHLRQDGLVVVASDHGFGPTSSSVLHINRYLAELGVLHYRPGATSGASTLRAAALRRIDGIARGWLDSDRKKRLAARFPALRRRWEASLTGADRIDWSRTRAWCSEVIAFPQNIWVNVRGRRPSGIVDPGPEYRDLVAFLADRFLALRHPVTGRRVVDRVFRKEEAFSGPYLDHAPDLVLAWWEGAGVTARPSLPGDAGRPAVEEATTAEGERAEWTGTHRVDGILAMDGPGIRRGHRIAGARIVDVAPTILHFLGRPVPDDMDGRVLTDVFDDEGAPQGPVRFERGHPTGASAGDQDTYSPEEAELIHQRLQDLGYIE